MAKVIHCGPRALPGLLEEHARGFDREVKAGSAAAAVDGAHVIEPNLPIAFGPLRASLHVDAEDYLQGRVRIVLDAPHAAAIEAGSRPHMPPLAPLIAWVKLRGMQGIDKEGNIRSPGKMQRGRGGRFVAMPGNTTAANAHAVAMALKQLESPLGILNVNAPEKIARAIQASIAKHGTRPHWPVRSSLPKIRVALDRRMKRTLKRP